MTRMDAAIRLCLFVKGRVLHILREHPITMRWMPEAPPDARDARASFNCTWLTAMEPEQKVLTSQPLKFTV